MIIYLKQIIKIKINIKINTNTNTDIIIKIEIIQIMKAFLVLFLKEQEKISKIKDLILLKIKI
jgi:hypothetical protein